MRGGRNSVGHRGVKYPRITGIGCRGVVLCWNFDGRR